MMETYEATVDFVHEVVEYLNALDYDCEAEIYNNYSGRGMYGKTVPGVVVKRLTNELGAAIIMAAVDHYFDDWALENQFEDVEASDISSFLLSFSRKFNGLKRSDSMGLGIIYY